MDEPYVRQQLDSLRNELARFEDERNVLVNLIRNYETWLRMHGKEVTVSVGSKTISIPAPDAEAQEQTVSFRGAVLRVLQDAHGEPLHAKEILRRAEELGAHTSAKNPLSMISLNIRSLGKYHPIEKAGPRMWRWAGEGSPGQ